MKRKGMVQRRKGKKNGRGKEGRGEGLRTEREMDA
jgi:hypothetical protein